MHIRSLLLFALACTSRPDATTPGNQPSPDEILIDQQPRTMQDTAAPRCPYPIDGVDLVTYNQAVLYPDSYNEDTWWSDVEAGTLYWHRLPRRLHVMLRGLPSDPDVFAMAQGPLPEGAWFILRLGLSDDGGLLDSYAETQGAVSIGTGFGRVGIDASVYGMQHPPVAVNLPCELDAHLVWSWEQVDMPECRGGGAVEVRITTPPGYVCPEEEPYRPPREGPHYDTGEFPDE